MTAEANKGFEFDQGQNQVLADLAGKMLFVSLMLMTLGAFVLIGGVGTLLLSLTEGTRTLIVGIMLLLIGGWTRKASRSFQEIVDTEGSDISHMMNAMEQLRRLYSLQYWACLVAILLILAGLAAQLVL